MHPISIGDIQINNTHLHHRFKTLYWLEEQKLMLKRLDENPSKIPETTRQEMINMTIKVMTDLDKNEGFDASKAFQSLFI